MNDNVGAKLCPVKFEDFKIFALVDSGADVSVISETSFKRIKAAHILSFASTFDLSLKGVTGHGLQIVGKAKLKFQIGEQSLIHEFYVVNNSTKQMILGSDFFISSGAKIDLRNKTLALGDQIIVLRDKLGVPVDCAVVYTASRVVLPPRSVTMVKLKGTSRLYGTSVVSPLDTSPLLIDHPGVLVPNILVTGKSKLQVPVVNETYAQVSVRKGLPLGVTERLSEAEVGSIETRTQPPVRTYENQQSQVGNAKLDHVAAHQRRLLRQLLEKYSEIFSVGDTDLGRTSVVQMKLDTGDHPPVKQKPYKTPFAERPMVERQLDDMLEAGVISPSNSPWASPIVVVPKKDGSKRLCVDYRRGVNKVLKSNSYPLPDISDILSSLYKAKYFSCVDLKSGYWQVEVAPEDREKTAFVCHRGLYEFNVMPFGLSSAPPIFQELMNKVLGEAMYKYAIAYIDDVIIYSETFQDHLKHLNEVFSKLRDAGLKLKMSKCQFLMEQIRYLGHVISKDGIYPDPEKIRVIQDLRPPKNVREVRSVVGMASYYRKFIDHFSEVVGPLTELTKKHAKFHWSSEHSKAFQTIKQKLVQAPVLAHPDPSRPYILSTDASLIAVGAVLTQETDDGEKVIQYLSKKLSEGQQKWPTIEREAYAIVYTVNKLRHYLLGSKFTVYTDHKPLKSLFTSEMKNARIQRWAIMLEEYGCQVEYKQGKSNVPADMLSRMVNPQEEGSCDVLDNAPRWSYEPPKETGDEEELSMNPLADELQMQAIREQQQKDPVIREIMDHLVELGDEVDSDYVVQDGLLYHISIPVKNDPNTRLQLVIPAEMTGGVIHEMHSAEFGGGHVGLDRTYDKIRSRYYWQNMYRDVVKYLEQCEICKARKMRKTKAPMQDMPIPQYPFEIIGIDTCGPFPETELGNKYIVTIVDHFSSWPEAYATRDKSAETVASILVEHIFPRHSCPRVLLSDRGTEFVNAVVSYLLEKMKVCHLKTSPYHPQTNGKTERFHRFMNDVLSKYVQQEHCLWDRYLPGMLMAYRTSVNDTTRHTPFFICHGRDPVLPMDTLLGPKLRYVGDDYVPCMLQRLHVAYSDVQKNMLEARTKNKRILDRKAALQAFEPGDRVFYHTPIIDQNASSKLTSKWKPYFCVVEKVSPVLYKIRNQLSGDSKVVHVENLQPAHPEQTWDRGRTQFDYFEAVRPKHKQLKRVVPTRVQPARAAKLVTSVPQQWFKSEEEHSSSESSQEELQSSDQQLSVQSPVQPSEAVDRRPNVRSEDMEVVPSPGASNRNEDMEVVPSPAKRKKVLKRRVDPSPERVIEQAKRNKREVSVMDAIHILGRLVDMLEK